MIVSPRLLRVTCLAPFLALPVLHAQQPAAAAPGAPHEWKDVQILKDLSEEELT